MQNLLRKFVLHTATVLSIFPLGGIGDSVMRYDLQDRTNGTVTFTAGDKKLRVWVFSHRDCKDSAILFKVINKSLDGVTNDWTEDCPIVLEYSAHNTSFYQHCLAAINDCMMMKPLGSAASDFPLPTGCRYSKPIESESIFPIIWKFTWINRNQPSVKMHFQLLSKVETLPTVKVQTTASTPEPGAIDHSQSTMPTAKKQTTAPQSTKKFSTKHPESGTIHENNCNNSVDRIMTILFGVMFAITLAALIVVSFRLLVATKHASGGAHHAHENTSYNDDTQVTCSVTNKATKGHANSEQEVVVNEIYEMS